MADGVVGIVLWSRSRLLRGVGVDVGVDNVRPPPSSLLSDPRAVCWAGCLWPEVRLALELVEACDGAGPTLSEEAVVLDWVEICCRNTWNWVQSRQGPVRLEIDSFDAVGGRKLAF